MTVEASDVLVELRKNRYHPFTVRCNNCSWVRDPNFPESKHTLQDCLDILWSAVNSLQAND